MRRLRMTVVTIALAATCVHGQQTTLPPAAPAKASPERVKVYSPGKGVAAPVLLPSGLQLVSSGMCRLGEDGEVQLSLLVDTTGAPRNIMFLRPRGDDLDRLALRVVELERFKPATLDGKPVVVAVSLRVNLRACVEVSIGSPGKPASFWGVRSEPRQKLDKLKNPPEEAVLSSGDAPLKKPTRPAPRPDYFGGEVSAPVLLRAAEAHYTEKARNAGIQGICVVSLTVDRNGLPENAQVLRSIDPELDRNAIHAVDRYRFFPAIKNGEPVPATITIDVSFTPPPVVVPDLEPE